MRKICRFSFEREYWLVVICVVVPRNAQSFRKSWVASKPGGGHDRDRPSQDLRFALLLVGVIFAVGIYPLTIIWPSDWSWHTGQSAYLQMILGIYATLGVFLIIASREPLAHRSLIWFAVWSSVVHGVIMAAQSFADRIRLDTCGAMYWRCSSSRGRWRF